MNINDLLDDDAWQRAVVQDALLVLDDEVSGLSGASGSLIRTTYAALGRVRPGFIENHMTWLLPRLARVLGPRWQAAIAAGDPDGYFDQNSQAIAGELLAVTDGWVDESRNRSTVGLYRRIRPHATRHVQTAMPRLVEFLDKHFPQVELDDRGVAIDSADVSIAPRLHVGLDSALAIGRHRLVVNGWAANVLRPELAVDIELRLFRTNDQGVPEQMGAFRVPELAVARVDRSDVLRGLALEGSSVHSPGFLLLLEQPGVGDATTIEVVGRSADGQEWSEHGEVVAGSTSPLEFTRSVFTWFPDANPREFKRVLDSGVGSVVLDLTNSAKVRAVDVVDQGFVHQFGEPIADPDVTVIVPLYGRFDFLEYQLSQFVLDPDFHNRVDLIYLNDDPTISQDVYNLANAVSDILPVPFRLIDARVNLGFAGANNLAAQHARAQLLLLLNSDVLPRSTGWLGALIESHAALDDVGVLGVRLLYEDDAIQHDGMSHESFPYFDGLWICEHPRKGLPSSMFPPALLPVAVPAVTAACAMVDRQAYLNLGGLDEDYLLGDFEDSDLCLRFSADGRQNYVDQSVVLYHLERQSQDEFDDQGWKNRVSIYNCWLHHQRWAQQLGSVA